MKFWQKIYLFSLSLVILAISLTGVILIQNLHNKLMENEIEKSITEAKLLAREIQTEDIYFRHYAKIDSSKIKRSLDVIIRDYILTTPCEGKFQLLDINNNILFTDIDFPEMQTYEVADNLSSDITNFIIKEVNDKRYVYICSLSPNNNLPIKVLYAKDITAIYSQQYDDYIFFAKLALWICCLFSIFMFFISRLLTNPIKKFTLTAQEIAAGNYLQRVQIHSKDVLIIFIMKVNT